MFVKSTNSSRVKNLVVLLECRLNLFSLEVQPESFNICKVNFRFQKVNWTCRGALLCSSNDDKKKKRNKQRGGQIGRKWLVPQKCCLRKRKWMTSHISAIETCSFEDKFHPSYARKVRKYPQKLTILAHLVSYFSYMLNFRINWKKLIRLLNKTHTAKCLHILTSKILQKIVTLIYFLYNLKASFVYLSFREHTVMNVDRSSCKTTVIFIGITKKN